MKIMGWNGLFYNFFILICTCREIFAHSPPLLDEVYGYQKSLDFPSISLTKGASRLRLMKQKLPDTVIPLKYEIRILIYLDEIDQQTADVEFMAEGAVRIIFSCSETTRNLVINADLTDAMDKNKFNVTDLTEVDENHTRLENGISYRVVDSNYDSSSMTVDMLLSHDLEEGKLYELIIDFETKIFQDSLEGLYASYYEDPNDANKKEYLALTQLEATSARRVFPCFDEPHLKATFKLMIGHHVRFKSISNTNIERILPLDAYWDWVWDVYEETPTMSTYLVAVIISKFSCIRYEAWTFEHEVCGQAEKIMKGQGNHAATKGAVIMKFYEYLLKQKYMGEKMSSIAVPHFRSGAMENLGACVYRDYLLLYKGIYKSTEAKRRKITTILAHELAHQWFGNLVTCAEWNHLWLNEGFATYFSHLGLAVVTSDLRDQDFIYELTTRVAHEHDSKVDSPALTNTSDTSARFDKITYKKGAALLRMIQHCLGTDTFFSGIQNYLAKNQFGSVYQRDFLFALDEAIEINPSIQIPPNSMFSKMLESWTFQPGFPILRVSRKSNDIIEIQQDCFTKEARHKQSCRWDIPIFINISPGTAWLDRTQYPAFWLPKEQKKECFNIQPLNVTDWIIINPSAAAFVKTVYDEGLKNRIVMQLKKDSSIFNSITRANLIDDYFSSAKAGHVKVSAALDFTLYLEQEKESVVWNAVFDHLNPFYKAFSEHPESHFVYLQRYISPKFEKLLQFYYIMFDEHATNGNDFIFIGRLLKWALAFKVSIPNIFLRTVLRAGNHSYLSHLTNRAPMDMHEPLFCFGISNDLDGFEESVYDMYLDEDEDERHMICLKSLMCSMKSSFLSEMLLKTVSEEPWKTDSKTIFNGIMANSVGRNLVITKLLNDFESFVSTHNIEIVLELLKEGSTYWNSEEKLRQLKELFELHNKYFEDYDEKVKETLETVQDNIEWMASDGKEALDWLKMTLES